MKTIELFKMIHDNGEWANGVKNGDVHRDNITADEVASLRAQLSHLGVADRFRFEGKGLFKAREVTYTVDSMSRSDIEKGGDNDPFEMVNVIYTPA